MSATGRMKAGGSGAAWAGWGILAIAAGLLFLLEVWRSWPPAGDALQEILLLYGVLPRGAVALIAGAALGLSGALMQRVLRNPIADPSTIGVVAGAQLAMTAATIYAPAWMEAGREPVAFLGGALALAFVLALSLRRGLDPVTVVLSGMLVSLIAAALSATLVLANGEYMLSLFIWGGGALEQQSWQPTLSLLLRLVLAGAAVAILIRPLTLLTLNDEGARSLGLAVSAVRLAILVVAVLLAATVTAAVGVIGFIGLAAPNLVRMAGARTPNQILAASPAMGALILLFTDGAVQAVSSAGTGVMPTGAATALIGGPLILWLLPRLHGGLRPAAAAAARQISSPATILALLAASAVILTLIALFIGRGAEGWAVASGAALDLVLPWRWPRVMAAAAAGAMLAAAGMVLQRVTGNPMASPEVLGVSAGAGLGTALMLLLTAEAPGSFHFLGAVGGSLAALALLLVLSVRNRFGPERLLLSGIAIGAFSGAAVTTVMARGGTDAMWLLQWISGSTADTTPAEASLSLILAVLFIAPLPFLLRWLSIMPLGPHVARAIGLSQAWATAVLVFLAALLSAAATLVVGPLSFVGLMAPHLARMSGFTSPGPHLAASILFGVNLMLFADWMSRMLTFPYQLPLGLFASLVGGPYLIWVLNRRRA